jgi:hypothetical protein
MPCSTVKAALILTNLITYIFLVTLQAEEDELNGCTMVNASSSEEYVELDDI